MVNEAQESKTAQVAVAITPRPEKQSIFGKLLLTCLASVAMACAISVPISYHMALQLPVPPQVAVMSVEDAISDLKNKDVNDPVVSREISDRSEKLRAVAKELAGQGVVVLDAKYILQAPKDAFVDFAAATKTLEARKK